MLRRPLHPRLHGRPTHGPRGRWAPLLLGCLLSGCSSTTSTLPPRATSYELLQPRDNADPPWLPADAHAGVRHQALCDLLKQEWAGSLKHDPLWASELGIHALDDQLPDRSRSDIAAWQQNQRRYLALAEAIPDAELRPQEQLTKRLFIARQQTRLGSFACKSELWALDARDNPLVELNRIPEVTQLT